MLSDSAVPEVPPRTVARLVAIALLAGLAVWLMLGRWLEPSAAGMAGILVAVIFLWISEAMPLAIPPLVGTAFAASMGIVPAKEAFASMADRIVILFIGSFILAQALEKHGLSRRIAYAALALPAVGRSPLAIFWAVSAVNFLISAWVSNTATCAMMLPIVLGIVARIRSESGPDAAQGLGFSLAFTCAFSASIGGLLTPVGTPPNLIGIGQLERVTGTEVKFFDWFAAVSPPAFGIWLLGCLWLSRNVEPAGSFPLDPGFAREKLRELGAMSSSEKWTLAALVATILGWLVPPAFVALELPGGRLLERVFAEPFVPLYFTFPLFFLGGGSRREAALGADDFAAIDWNTIFLYGGGLCIGSLIEKSGLSKVISTAFAGIPAESPALVLLAAVVLAVVMSEFASNTASANIIAPILAAASGAFDIPVGPFMLAATAACTLGFLLPVSTPLNAMVYASGEVPLRKMIRTGLVMDLIGIVLLTGWFLWKG